VTASGTVPFPESVQKLLVVNQHWISEIPKVVTEGWKNCKRMLISTSRDAASLSKILIHSGECFLRGPCNCREIHQPDLEEDLIRKTPTQVLRHVVDYGGVRNYLHHVSSDNIGLIKKYYSG
jgi:hypothetical protein